MTRFASLILIMIFLITGACSSRKSRLDKRHMIPEKEMVSLMTDFQIADGLLILPKITSWTSSLDSITTYIQIIEKHGYTKEIFDKTMKYYFYHDPKKLNKIYDQVLGILSEMESRIIKESATLTSPLTNQWPGKEYYLFPASSGSDSTMFDMALYRTGLYTLSFSVTLYPDDQSVNPKPSVFLTSPDSINTGKRQYLKSIYYLKDGLSHNYSLTFTIPEKKPRNVRGWLFDFDNLTVDFEKHIKIENISITFGSQKL
jgi:hypothetical protein